VHLRFAEACALHPPKRHHAVLDPRVSIRAPARDHLPQHRARTVRCRIQHHDSRYKPGFPRHFHFCDCATGGPHRSATISASGHQPTMSRGMGNDRSLVTVGRFVIQDLTHQASFRAFCSLGRAKYSLEKYPSARMTFHSIIPGRRIDPI
jgi:hypothetical protein